MRTGKKGSIAVMFCENCNNELSNTAMICPICGVTTPRAREFAGNQPSQTEGTFLSTPEYSPNVQQQPGYTPYQQGYAPQQFNYPPQQLGQAPQQQYYAPGYQPGVNVTVVTNPGTNTNSSAVLVEVLLNSLVWLFGIGWIMAGETTTGIIMAICGYLVYAPLLIFFGFVTLGFGFCIIPFIHIGVLIANAILLNNTVKRKALQQTVLVRQI